MDSYDVMISGKWNGPALGAHQYLKLEIFSTEAAWNDNDPSGSFNITPDATYGTFTTAFGTNVGIYCARGQVVDTQTPLHNSGVLAIPHEYFTPVSLDPVTVHSCAIVDYNVLLKLNMNGVYLDGYYAYLKVEFLNQIREVYHTYTASNVAIGPELFSRSYDTPSIPDYIRLSVKSEYATTWTLTKEIYIGGYSYNG